ncbi:MAG: hypothetical protein JW744_00505 [Candidatus Diapherotrites archaeon]|uniref:Uncharacterized protein n=1 Tax=Candidatus Iainarchaeum sp. TaxID=3101447 RepID=A0A939C475_9ARCH|nr:hypothetical protein [Candidatus Diapherotrites archaeon]
MSLDDVDDEEQPRRKRKGRPFFTRKRVLLMLAIVVIFAAGAILQHYYIEPLYGETVTDKYTRCLQQNAVLDERFVDCDNSKRACEYQLEQC